MDGCIDAAGAGGDRRGGLGAGQTGRQGVKGEGEGRTRHDQSIGDVGPYATAVGEPSQVIMINDPVSGAHYTLEPRSKTARKMTFNFNKVGDYETVDVKGKQVLTPEQMAEG